MRKLFPNRLRRFIALACAALLLCAIPAEAEMSHSLALTRIDDWVIVQTGATVYRDPELTQPWVILPGCIVKRRYDLGNGCTGVSNGKRLGYMKSEDLTKPSAGVQLYASRNTRAYQAPSLKSRWINVPQGTTVELVSLNGSCAEVRKDGKTAYMYIAHLRPIGTSTAV